MFKIKPKENILSYILVKLLKFLKTHNLTNIYDFVLFLVVRILTIIISLFYYIIIYFIIAN